MNRKFTFELTCVESTADRIHAMQDAARQITCETFKRRCNWREWADSMGYDRDLQLEKDWAVGFYKSIYYGRPCYYVQHSRIEHIFT